MLLQFIRFPLMLARSLSVLIVVAGVLYHAFLDHAGRLSEVPDGERVVIAGRVVRSQAFAEPRSHGGCFVVEDLTGLADVIWLRGGLPTKGKIVLVAGHKREIDCRPVVVAHTDYLRP